MTVPAADTTGPPAPQRRFDPFRLPSATSIRFVLLMAGASIGAMYVGLWYLPYLSVILDQPLPLADTCAEQAGNVVGAGSDRAVLETFLDCLTGRERLAAWWFLGAVPVWAVTTAVVYTAYPVVLRRRLRALRLPRTSGAVRAAEQALHEEPGGAARRVTLLVTPGTAGGARVFGAWGRYWIAIDLALLTAPFRGRSRAVIRHELAHLRNRDVDLTYLAVASWWALLGMTLLPLPAHLFVFTRAGGGEVGPAVLRMTATALLVLAVLHLARARVLRTREHYADLRAAAAAPGDPELERALAALAQTGAKRSRWHALRGYHPPPEERRRVLDAPDRLVRVSGVDLFFAGAVLGVGQTHLALVARLLAGNDEYHGHGAASLLLGSLVGVVVAAVVWNAVDAAGGRPRGLGRAAGALAGGVLLGCSVPHEFAPGGLVPLAAHPELAVLSALLLWLACLVFLRWAALGARMGLGASRRWRKVYASTLGCAAVAFGCLSTVWVIVNGHLGEADALGRALAVWGGLFAASQTWYFTVGLGCAALCVAALPQAGESRGERRWRRWAPVLLGHRVAGVHLLLVVMAILISGVVAGGGPLPSRWSPDLRLAAAVAGALLSAALSGAGLGVLLGGRGRSGVALCASVVMVLVTAALQPFAFAAAVNGAVCLAEPASAGCWARAGTAVLGAFGTAGLGPLAVVALLLVCLPATAAGAALRARRKAPPRPAQARPAPAAGAAQAERTGGYGVLAAVLALVVLLAGWAADSLARRPLVHDGPRPELAARVRPGTVERTEVCEQAGDVFPGSDVLDVRSGREALLVLAASSRDPVLAAFGNAALDGAEVPWSRFLRAVAYYCQETEGPR